jgi:hypothetical protein
VFAYLHVIVQTVQGGMRVPLHTRKIICVFTFETSTDPVIKGLKSLQKQIRFAAANACNKTAKEVQDFTINQLLPDEFELRSRGQPWQKPGGKMGFNILYANKETVQAVIGSQADWLKLQESGGVKKVSGHRIAIPTPFWKERKEIMEAKKKPRAILERKLSEDLSRATANLEKAKKERARFLSGGQRRVDIRIRDAKKNVTKVKRQINRLNRATKAGGNKPFDAKLKSGLEGIFVRVGDDPPGKAKAPIKALFIYKDTATIPGGLGFEVIGSQMAGELLPKHLEWELIKAMATANL